MATVDGVSIQRVRALTDDELLALPAVIDAFGELNLLEVRPTAAVRVMAHQPEICAPWFRLAAAFNVHSVLSDRDRERMILRVAHRRQCEMVWDFHKLLARRAGLSSGDVRRVMRQPIRAEPADDDAVLIAATDEILDDGRLSTELFERMRKRYSDAQLVELPLAIRFFDANCSFIETLGITGSTESSLGTPGQTSREAGGESSSR